MRSTMKAAFTMPSFEILKIQKETMGVPPE
jgi:hypothetical protein